jgi:hypothetical protein
MRDTARQLAWKGPGWGSTRGARRADTLGHAPTLALSLKILGFALAGMLLGCSRQAVERQRLPDGTFVYSCESELPACLSKVDEVCKGGPYFVHGAWDEPKTSGVEQYQVESHRSRVHFRCVTPGSLEKNLSDPSAKAPAAVASAPEPSKAAPASTTQPSPPAPPPATARACVPGTTQSCVGAAACSGGQACLADGSGFGPCDCGTR